MLTQWYENLNMLRTFINNNRNVIFENSIRDARTPQPGEIVFNTMTYRSSERVQRLGYFQRSVTYIMFK